jgi:hypothetical protein
VFVDHGLLVYTLDDFAYDDRVPTLAGSGFPRSGKDPVYECYCRCSGTFCTRYLRVAQSYGTPQTCRLRRTLRRRSSYPSGAHSKQQTFPITLSEGCRRPGSLRKRKVRHTPPGCGARGGRSGRFRAIAPRLESTSHNRPGLQHGHPTACSVDSRRTPCLTWFVGWSGKRVWR